MTAETFREMCDRLVTDPAPHAGSAAPWDPQARLRWQRVQAKTAVEWLLTHPAPGPGRDDIEQVVHRLGRIWGPYVLDVLHTAGALTADTATLAGPGGMPRASWLRVFALAGYTVDGERAKRPAGPVRLYRGAPRSHRFRMAWTDDRATAEWFARAGIRSREASQVWTADVAPDRLLARMHEGGRGESEYVINTRGLRVVPFE